MHKELITILASICKVLWDKLIQRAIEELALKIYSLLSEVWKPYRSKLWSVAFGKSFQELWLSQTYAVKMLHYFTNGEGHTSFFILPKPMEQPAPQLTARPYPHPATQFSHLDHLWPEYSPLLPLFLLHVHVHIGGNSCYHSECGPCICKRWISLIISAAFYQENRGPVVESFLV